MFLWEGWAWVSPRKTLVIAIDFSPEHNRRSLLRNHLSWIIMVQVQLNAAVFISLTAKKQIFRSSAEQITRKFHCHFSMIAEKLRVRKVSDWSGRMVERGENWVLLLNELEVNEEAGFEVIERILIFFQFFSEFELGGYS